MSVAHTDYIAAIANLPAGAILCADDFAWEEYENLLADLGESYSVRIFYDRGRMEIMAPGSAQRPKSAINRLITALGDELDIDIESLGSTILKMEMKGKGAEPDDCFYVQNASLIIGKEDLDLMHDPPPDIVVEIDRTSTSLDKFAIYAALEVPEIWRATGRKVQFYLRAGAAYKESPVSQAFPFLTSQTLSDFVERALEDGGRKAAALFESGSENTILRGSSNNCGVLRTLRSHLRESDEHRADRWAQGTI